MRGASRRVAASAEVAARCCSFAEAASHFASVSETPASYRLLPNRITPVINTTTAATMPTMRQPVGDSSPSNAPIRRS